jgi:Domain of unknown function (DUF4834)
MGLLRLILIALCVYVAFKWIIGPFLRILLQNYLKNMVEKQGGQFREQQQQQKKKTDGSIHVDYIPKNPAKHKSDDSEGEYIDYEEVK